MRFPQFKKSSTEDRLYTVNYSQGFLWASWIKTQ